jgi:hypothetical protein
MWDFKLLSAFFELRCKISSCNVRFWGALRSFQVATHPSESQCANLDPWSNIACKTWSFKLQMQMGSTYKKNKLQMGSKLQRANHVLRLPFVRSNLFSSALSFLILSKFVSQLKTSTPNLLFLILHSFFTNHLLNPLLFSSLELIFTSSLLNMWFGHLGKLKVNYEPTPLN